MSKTVVDNILLSHHGPADRYRCMVLALPRAKYLICTRCLGAFIGFLLGLPVLWFHPLLISPWLLFLAFPDWIAHTLLKFGGHNAIRFASGVIIGIVYALNLRELLHLQFRSELWTVNVLAVVVYGVTVCWDFRLRRRRFVPCQCSTSRGTPQANTCCPAPPHGDTA